MKVLFTSFYFWGNWGTIFKYLEKKLCWGHTVSKWWSWDMIPGSLAPDVVPFTNYAVKLWILYKSRGFDEQGWGDVALWRRHKAEVKEEELGGMG